MSEGIRSLSDIINEAQLIMDQLFESGGEITPETEALLAGSKLELKQKIDAYGFIIDQFKARKDYAIGKTKEWGKVADQCERALEYLESKVKTALTTLELSEIHGHEYTFKLRANPPSVVVENEAAVPGDYIVTETKTTTRVDKKKILEVLKTGASIPGVHLERGIKLISKVSERKLIGGQNE
jgi:hypothetical protein